ncbi:ASPM [Cordylochernes scorpioides]|uniref:ASPM n=1 Tax=Cordylochernes scorpioides TaxID=51811 RepID=A0ABY6LDR7_9ARAC|nr:ASPM [Cordylochernes scorpioides]
MEADAFAADSNMSTDTAPPKMVELLLHNWNLSSKLRVPAISRLQKVHNVELALSALKESGLELPSTIQPRDIVDGHREKTLELLWTILLKSQIEILLEPAGLVKEILFLRKQLKLQKSLKLLQAFTLPSSDPGTVGPALTGYHDKNSFLKLLLRWCQAVCSLFDVESNPTSKCKSITSRFHCVTAGVLCYILHYYQPDLLPRSAIRELTTLTRPMDTVPDKKELTVLLANERENLRLFLDKAQELGGVPLVTQPGDVSNTIPDERVMITLLVYLNTRLLNLSREIRAARLIQTFWRTHYVKAGMASLQGLLPQEVVTYPILVCTKLMKANMPM